MRERMAPSFRSNSFTNSLIDPTVPQPVNENTNQQIFPDSSDQHYMLSKSDLHVAYCISKEKPKWDYRKIQQCLAFRTNNNSILEIDPEDFQESCKLAFAKERGIEFFLTDLWKTRVNTNLFKERLKFLSDISNLKSGFLPGDPIHIGPWANVETEILLNVLENGKKNGIQKENGKINWPIVSLFIPGRNGNQCKQHFFNLSKNNQYGKKLDPEDNRAMYEFKNNHISALSDKEELMLYNELSSDIDNGRVVTRINISQRAFDIYYSPVSMARKAVFSHFLKKGITVYGDNEEVDPQYIDEYNQKFLKYLIIANEEPQAIMNKFNLRNFKASMSWVSKFMKRHGLVFRKAHYTRRGAIKREWADQFLLNVADAIAKYGFENVVNMDETHVCIDNSSGTVISHKGQDKVTIYRSHVNTKEGFTAIATCSQVRKFPLIVITKGKKLKRPKKQIIVEDSNTQETSSITHFRSESGWTNVDVMKNYLDWLYEQMNHKPCALIIDCFKAHIDEEIKKYAKQKNIELIIVPACGTGIYQPLDRKIFGILKAKLRADENQRQILQDEKQYKNRFKIVEAAMEAAWEEISEEALTSGWDIPGLARVPSVLSDSSSSDDENYSDTLFEIDQDLEPIQTRRRDPERDRDYAH